MRSTFPIVRDMDTNMYERQHGGDLEVGSYAHRPILMAADDIPSIEESRLSPTELPFTQDDFDLQMEQALELVPDILGDERVGVRYAINGLLSLTPDGMPILGETPEVKGLWSVAAVWIKEAPGIARMVSEWMTDGKPEIDPHASDVARFWPHQRTTRARACALVRRLQQDVRHRASGRAMVIEPRRAPRPFIERQRALDGVFVEAVGWERPNWYASNEPLLAEYGDRVLPRDGEWESRWWSPLINAEHLAMRDRVGMVDLTAFTILDVTGPGALACPPGDGGRRDGRGHRQDRLHTPPERRRAGSRPTSSIMRLGPDTFRVVTGGASGQTDRMWFRDHLPADGSAQLTDVTSGWTTLGVLGPSRTRPRRIADRRRPLARGVPVRDLPHARARAHPGARVAYLVRR